MHCHRRGHNNFGDVVRAGSQIPSGLDRSLLLVIPTVLEQDRGIRFDRDFSNNLEAYLAAFDSVTVACPAARAAGTFPGTRTLDEILGWERVRTVVLPEPYREDRYLLNLRRISALLVEEIERARYILISPHAPFDWSTLAAEICIRKGRRYNMEADWNLPETSHYIWSRMPFGPNKLRERLWLAYHNRKYRNCLKNSSLSLLQGEDVFNAYRAIAPNAHSVLNVQITREEKISAARLKAKLMGVAEERPLRLVYAGRAIEMKGPLHWLETLRHLRDDGVSFEARWFGTGALLPDMERFIARHGLEHCCRIEGSVERLAVFEAMRDADLFLFCHMGKESPRCLVEALASAAPLVGFGSDYSRSLVRDHGGGVFVEQGDSAGLARSVAALNSDRAALAGLIEGAAETGQKLNRDEAIQQRIALMKQYL